jgi:hypothetical protein
MDVEADGDFDNDEEEVEDDTDDKGAVDLFEVDGVMVVAKAVGVVVVVTVVVVFVFVVVFVGVVVGMVVIVVVVVGMGGSHKGIVLSVVISCWCESVDDLAVCVGIGGVGDKGRDGMGGAGSKEVFLSADDHFQFAVEDKGNLFVGMAVFGQPATCLDLPNGKGAFVAVD